MHKVKVVKITNLQNWQTDPLKRFMVLGGADFLNIENYENIIII